MACVQSQDTLASVSLSLSTLLNLVLRNTLYAHGALRRCLLLCATADDMQMLSCSQLSLCLELTKERTLFVSGTRYFLLGVIARFLLNAITKCTAMLPLLCWHLAALRCGSEPVVTTALSCINASSRMLQGVDAVFQPIVGALSRRGL